jgi:hypothetical protein
MVAANARCDRRQDAGRASHLVGVDDICSTDGSGQRWYDRPRRVTADMAERPEDPDL